MSQHLEALESANRIRLARAQLKREIKAGDLKLSELLAEPELPDFLERMHLEELLFAGPRMYRRTLHSALAEVPIALTATVGGVTYRQRRRLADALGKWEGRQAIYSGGKRARRHAGHRPSGPAARAIAGRG